jgi:Na+/H+-dicarboxylate symporter
LQTLFDWAAIAVFAGLVVLFLHRSTSEVAVDRIYHYAPPAVGCAIGNYVGNLGVQEGRTDLQAFAGVTLLACIAYIFHILRPFRNGAGGTG